MFEFGVDMVNSPTFIQIFFYDRCMFQKHEVSLVFYQSHVTSIQNAIWC